MTTFKQCYDGYLLSQRARNISKSYLELLGLSRDYWLRRHPDGDLAAIDAGQVRAWITWLQGDDGECATEPPKLASPSVYIHFRNLRAFFNWCVAEDLITVSPMRKLKRPKVEEKLPAVLTEREVAILLKRVKDAGNPQSFRDYCIHLFFIDTGVRLEELSKLDVEDVNLEQGYAKVEGKGRRERIVPLGLRLRRELHRYMLRYRKAVKAETALFVNDEGFRFERQGIRMMIVRDQHAYIERTLAKYGPHTERHTSATIDLRENHDLQRVSQRLGHRQLSTTQRYLHLNDHDMLWGEGGSPVDRIIADKSLHAPERNSGAS